MSIDSILPFEVFNELVSLKLSRNNITHIPRLVMRNLTFLDLSYNRIIQIENLNLKKLKILNLNNNRISNIEELIKLTSLTDLYIENNPISNRDIDWLVKSLPNCKIYVDKKILDIDYESRYSCFISSNRKYEGPPQGWSSSDI